MKRYNSKRFFLGSFITLVVVLIFIYFTNEKPLANYLYLLPLVFALSFYHVYAQRNLVWINIAYDKSGHLADRSVKMALPIKYIDKKNSMNRGIGYIYEDKFVFESIDMDDCDKENTQKKIILFTEIKQIKTFRHFLFCSGILFALKKDGCAKFRMYKSDRKKMYACLLELGIK